MPQPPATCAARAEDSRGGSSGPAALSRAFVCLQCARCAGGAGPPPPTATANVLTSHTPVKPVKPEWSRSGRHSESTKQVAAAGPFPAFGPGAASRRACRFTDPRSRASACSWFVSQVEAAAVGLYHKQERLQLVCIAGADLAAWPGPAAPPRNRKRRRRGEHPTCFIARRVGEKL